MACIEEINEKKIRMNLLETLTDPNMQITDSCFRYDPPGKDINVEFNIRPRPKQKEPEKPVRLVFEWCDKDGNALFFYAPKIQMCVGDSINVTPLIPDIDTRFDSTTVEITELGKSITKVFSQDLRKRVVSMTTRIVRD